MIRKTAFNIFFSLIKIEPIKYTFLSLFFLLHAVNAVTLHANVRLPDIFSDHIVLQHSEVVNVWGWADFGEKISVSGNDVKISFDYAEEPIPKSDTLIGFQITGLDGEYHMANAKIIENRIIVSSEDIPVPKHVRFALYDAAEVFIYNNSGIPSL